MGQNFQDPLSTKWPTAYEPFGAPGAQGFQQSSPVEGPQTGGQEQFFQNQAPQVENNPFYQQGNPQAFQSQWNVQPNRRVDGLTLSSFLFLPSFLWLDRWRSWLFLGTFI
ncbi:hypothetical protein [Streptococcus rubneri]|uniref:hypothetical protein n=1 Tax=Streptococcus rubneri TaxID=1234680 RepID=UPI00214C2731|nr:hypothetical protein [Streptococcus rubneri]